MHDKLLMTKINQRKYIHIEVLRKRKTKYILYPVIAIEIERRQQTARLEIVTQFSLDQEKCNNQEMLKQIIQDELCIVLKSNF